MGVVEFEVGAGVWQAFRVVEFTPENDGFRYRVEQEQTWGWLPADNVRNFQKASA